jgi:hypothetical protein
MGVLVLCSVSSAAQNDATFDVALKHILRASKDRFIPIEGARIENRRRDFFFEPRVYLPGATYCRIFELEKSWVFGCEWEPAKPPARFAGLYDQLAAKVEAALGTDWNKEISSRNARKEVLFVASERPTIQVIQQTRPPAVHLFVFPAGALARGISTLPDWQVFFHP